MGRFSFLKSLKFWHWFGIGVAVVASRSAKVRRIDGKIDNILDIIGEIEQMGKAQGGEPLPFEKIRSEFVLTEDEGRLIVQQFEKLSKSSVVISGIPSRDSDIA